MNINSLINLIETHYQWVFSGIGVSVLFYFFGNKNRTSSSNNKVVQKNIRTKGDVVGRDKH
jgi:hypothetical protein